jgi:stress response protein SCP2
MAVSLNKGQGISLSKTENNLSQVTIGLGWDIQEQKKAFLVDYLVVMALNMIWM